MQLTFFSWGNGYENVMEVDKLCENEVHDLVVISKWC